MHRSGESASVTTAMLVDFDHCMAILRPEGPAPFKADVRDAIAGYGRDYTARWLNGWRTTLEADAGVRNGT